MARNGGSPLPLGVESTQLPVGFDVRSEKKGKQVCLLDVSLDRLVRGGVISYKTGKSERRLYL